MHLHVLVSGIPKNKFNLSWILLLFRSVGRKKSRHVWKPTIELKKVKRLYTACAVCCLFADFAVLSLAKLLLVSVRRFRAGSVNEDW